MAHVSVAAGMLLLAGCGDGVKLGNVAAPSTTLSVLDITTTSAAGKSLVPFSYSYTTTEGFKYDVMFDSVALATDVQGAKPGFKYVYPTATGTFTNSSGAHTAPAAFPKVVAVFTVPLSGECYFGDTSATRCMTSSFASAREWSPQIFDTFAPGETKAFSDDVLTSVVIVRETAPMPKPAGYLLGISLSYEGGIKDWRVKAVNLDGTPNAELQQWFNSIAGG